MRSINGMGPAICLGREAEWSELLNRRATLRCTEGLRGSALWMAVRFRARILAAHASRHRQQTCLKGGHNNVCLGFRPIAARSAGMRRDRQSVAWCSSSARHCRAISGMSGGAAGFVPTCICAQSRGPRSPLSSHRRPRGQPKPPESRCDARARFLCRECRVRGSVDARHPLSPTARISYASHLGSYKPLGRAGSLQMLPLTHPAAHTFLATVRPLCSPPPKAHLTA